MHLESLLGGLDRIAVNHLHAAHDANVAPVRPSGYGGKDETVDAHDIRRHGAGGFLHADDNYGLDESFREEIAQIFPDAELTEIPPDHPVFHTFYDFPEGLPKIHEHDGNPPQAFGVFHEGRLVVFYSYESDLGDGWEDEDVHGDSEDLREAALRMGVNLFLFVLGQAVS